MALSSEQCRRLRLCGGVAFFAPVIAASASFAILRTAWLIGGPRMMTAPAGRSFWSAYEYGVLPGNALLGATVALVAVLLLYPVPSRRWRAAVGWFVASPVVYLVTYLAWERFWCLIR